MTRLARLVIPGFPHHVTQRGNRRQPVFFSDADYRLYLKLLVDGCAKAKTEVWAYCLMPNHVHLILVPSHEDGLRAALGDAHRRYTRHVNARQGWSGHLWQSRFSSFVMDEPHLLMAARYIEQNPVRAKLAATPRGWKWSSARAHLAGKNDGVVEVRPLLDLAGGWKAFLAGNMSESDLEAIRSHERTGHPLGGDGFFKKLEKRLGRNVKPRKPGRPKAE